MAGQKKDDQKPSVPPFRIVFYFGEGGWNIDTCHLGEGIIFHQLEKYLPPPPKKMNMSHVPQKRVPFEKGKSFIFQNINFRGICYWLVVSTHLKNISQIGSSPQVGVKIKNI